MHELSLAQSIIEIVEENIQSLKIIKVNSVKLKIGKLSNILPESLKFGFSALTAGTILEGAELIIEEIPVTYKCRKCFTGGIAGNMNFECGNCGSNDIELISGREMAVGEIEAEEDPE